MSLLVCIVHVIGEQYDTIALYSQTSDIFIKRYEMSYSIFEYLNHVLKNVYC